MEKRREGGLLKDLPIAGYNLGDLNVLLVAHKAEKNLGLYVKRGSDTTFSKFRSYPICSTSGVARPKRREGDVQIPEGFYYIDRFNRQSSFHLSLGINYPNRSDRILTHGTSPGSDIFIHGDCVAVGCLPMTDNQIKGIFVLAVLAKNSGQAKTLIYISPFDIEHEHVKKANETLSLFLGNPKAGYEIFRKSVRELKFSLDDVRQVYFSLKEAVY